MASGSQVCRANWPDLDMTAANRHNEATSRAVWLAPPEAAAVLMASMLKVLPPPAVKNNVVMPISRPMSPTRLVKKALRAASELAFSSHQWPMRTKLHTPTSSQAVMNMTRLLASTSNNMEAVNSDKKAKKWVKRTSPAT